MNLRRSRLISVLALVVAVGSLAALRLTLDGRPPRVDARLHEDIGRALALEALTLLGPGGRLTVVTRDTGAFPQPAADFALASFSQEARRTGAPVPAVQTLQVDPLRPVQVPPGDFYELIRRAAVGDVIVSFMGPPLLTDEQLAGLGAIKPRIVAFCPGTLSVSLNFRKLAEQGLLHAAVLSRPAKRLTTPPPAPGPETFDNLYLRANTADLLKLPAMAGQP